MVVDWVFAEAEEESDFQAVTLSPSLSVSRALESSEYRLTHGYISTLKTRHVCFSPKKTGIGGNILREF